MVVEVVPYRKIVKNAHDRFGDELNIADFRRVMGEHRIAHGLEFLDATKQMETFGYIRRRRDKIQLLPDLLG